MVLKYQFNKAVDESRLETNQRLDQQDYIGIKRPGQDWKEYIVNFDYIARTGDVHHYDPGTEPASYQIDFTKQDSFTATLNEINRQVKERINDPNDTELQTLLKKTYWGKEDREIWEERVSKIVAQVIDDMPGLEGYRTKNSDTVRRDPSLNTLSADIDARKKNPNAPYTIEFDCEALSVIKGLAMQNADKETLPRLDNTDDEANKYNYKRAANYFYVCGAVSWHRKDKPGGHAFIFSSATGNMIEGTWDPSKNDDSPYVRSKNKYTLRDLVADGRDFVGINDSVYGRHQKRKSHNKVRDEAESTKDNAKFFTRAEIQEQIEILKKINLNVKILDSEDNPDKKDHCIIAATVKIGDKYKTVLLQKRNIGMPNESYEVAGTDEREIRPGKSDQFEIYNDKYASERYSIKISNDSADFRMSLLRQDTATINSSQEIIASTGQSLDNNHATNRSLKTQTAKPGL
ncbi:MAG: hypothetical protein ACT4OY_01450 [Alphaproteobacteria bacterium]